MTNGCGAEYPFHAIFVGNDLEAIRLMFEKAGPFHARNILMNDMDQYGRNPFHAAVQVGSPEIVEYLLTLDPDVNQRTQEENGYTPLALACMDGRAEIVTILLEAGANPSLVSTNGFTPIHEATHATNLVIVRQLMDAGADVDSSGPDGSTPLCWAVVGGNEKLVEMLLEAGADPNVQGITCAGSPSPDTRITPLYAAVMNRQPGMTQILLAKGADPHWRSCRGHTTLHEAAKEGDLDCIQLLLAAGVDKDIMAEDGTRAEDWARASGHVDVAEHLSHFGDGQ